MPKGFDARRAELYLDEHFIGNANDNLPVLFVSGGGIRFAFSWIRACPTNARSPYLVNPITK